MVVIGGGSLGCQTTYHLAKMGLTNVVLLERDRLTSGTTWHTAGQLTFDLYVPPKVSCPPSLVLSVFQPLALALALVSAVKMRITSLK